jgi:hypothetical protein
VTSEKAAVPRLVSIDRRQLVLRTVDVERLIDEDHSARSIWDLIGRLDLSLYYAQIEAVEGHAGRNHTDPQLLISVWLYAYSRGISSAREVARQCEFEPGFQWLCGLEAISHRTLSGRHGDGRHGEDMGTDGTFPIPGHTLQTWKKTSRLSPCLKKGVPPGVPPAHSERLGTFNTSCFHE